MNAPQPYFRIEFRYTLEELAEGIAPLPEKTKSFFSLPQPSRLARTMLFLCFSAIVIFVAYVALSRNDKVELWNLDVTLPAALLPATYFFLLLIFQLVLLEYAPWFVDYMLYVALVAWLTASAPRQQWASNPAWERVKTIELDSGSFRTADQIIKLELAWAAIRNVRETKNLFVLQTESTLRHLIPKRAFHDEQELTRLRALLQNAVPDSEFLVDPAGFLVTPKLSADNGPSRDRTNP